MSNQYTDIEAVENYLLTNIDVAFEPQIEKWIEQMSQYIETKTGRIFIADEEESEKLYDGDGTNIIIIDDCIEVSKVEVDDSEITDYVVYPANDLPKTFIKLPDGIFTKGDQNITITAKWGYSVEVPEDIKFACTVLVSGMVNQSLNQEGEIQSINIGSYSVTYKQEKQWSDFDNVKNTLESYRRYY